MKKEQIDPDRNEKVVGGVDLVSTGQKKVYSQNQRDKNDLDKDKSLFIPFQIICIDLQHYLK
jgi:hypothetical protein